MPDPTPDPVAQLAPDESVSWLLDELAAQRALLAELLADHYARAHRTIDVRPEDECRVWAAQGMPGCQAPERTRRLGVEGAG